MTTAMEADLQRKYTTEERDALFDEYFDAMERKDEAEMDRLGPILPVDAHWAKIIAKIFGKDYLLENFNITYATEILGEGWLDAIQGRA
jgi:hypothetical protein